MAIIDQGSTAKTSGKFINNIASGGIDFEGDLDWFTFKSKPNTYYKITLDNEALVNGKLTLRDSKTGLEPNTENNALFSLYKSETVSDFYTLEFLSSSKATNYYIQVESSDPASFGDYTLTLEEVSDDYLGTTKTKGNLTASTPISGSIQWNGNGDTDHASDVNKEDADYADVDWIKLSAAANTFYTITLDDENVGEALASGTLKLFDSKGKAVTKGTGTTDDGELEAGEVYDIVENDDGTVSLRLLNGKKAANYYIEVSDKNAGTTDAATGDYELSVVVAEDDYLNTTKTKGLLTNDSDATSGAIDWAGDTDWFKLSAAANTYYRITLDDESLDGKLASGQLKIYDSRGKDVSNETGIVISNNENTDGDGAWNLEFLSASKSATYYIEVSDNDTVDTTLDTGNYVLNVDAITDDYGSTTKTKGALTTDAPTEGCIEWVDGADKPDSDWLKLSAAPSSLYRIVISEDIIDKVSDLSIILRDSKGNIIENADGVDALALPKGAGAVKIEQFDANNWVIAFFNATNKTSSFYLDLSADTTVYDSAGLVDIGYQIETQLYLSEEMLGANPDPATVIDNLPDDGFWWI